MAKEKPLSAGPVATLVAVIALFMIFYVLLLPPAERHALLNISDDSIGDAGRGTGSIEKADIILSVSPGLVSLDIEDENEHKITPINLFVRTEGEVVNLVSSLTVQRNIFSDKFQELRFDVGDLSVVKSTSLFFDVKKADGRLIIELNGNKIFNSAVDVGLKTVNLPLGYLNSVNTIKIYVSSPGLLFFTDNDYSLEDVRVSKKFKVVNAVAERGFSLSAVEKNNLDKANFDFSIYCREISSIEGRLRVFLNDQSVYSDIVVCDRGKVSIEIDPEFLEKGENVLQFDVDKGDYIIDPIVFRTELKGAALLSYNFFLDDEEFDSVWNGDRDAVLYLQFSDEVEKNFRFDINGDTIRLITDELDWNRDISGNIKEGTNFIRIIPFDEEFDIDLLEIRLE